MKLLAKDRLIILNILPTRGNFTTMSVKDDLKAKLKITQEEMKELEMTEENGMIKWNDDKDKEKEFDITEMERKIIKDTLNDLDEKEQLTDDTYYLFKLF